MDEDGLREMERADRLAQVSALIAIAATVVVFHAYPVAAHKR